MNIVLRKDEAPRYERDGITSYLLMSEMTTGARTITTSLVEMQPGGMQHIHAHTNEQTYTILEGHGVMTVGEETLEVSQGDSIFITSDVPHGLRNSGKSMLRYLSAASPAFGMDMEKELWPLPPLRDS